MPLKSGMELAEEIKMLKPDTPFLFLTGQADKEDRIKGLEAGADDYVTKPYSMQELYLRVKAILRRLEINTHARKITKSYSIGQYRFEADSREVTREGKTDKLSEIESKLLSMFCEAPDGIVSRDHALKRIWDDENSFRERSMNVYVSKLRQYLKDDPNIEIMNIHGFGYKLMVK
jgi:DNA-binding response OmpR family regulator